MKSKIFSFLMAAGMTVGMTIGFSSCSDDEEKLPPIDGFNNSDEVAATNLVAHWPMDGNANEKKSGATPEATQNATFVDGAKGRAVSLSSGYLAYGQITALNSLPNMTVSLWANFDNNGTHPTAFFSLTRPNEWAGNINMMSETGWKPAGNDTLVVKGLVVTNKDGNPSFQDTRNEPSNGGVQTPTGVNKWQHLVMTWDGSTSNFKMYVNGVKVSNPDWEQRGDTGPLNFFTPTRAIIGAWGTNVAGGNAEEWQKPMNGLVDEVRVYNKALSDAEIGSLFKLESVGR